MELRAKQIISLAKSQNGYITTKQIENLGISRVYIKDLVDDGFLFRIGRGKYLTTNQIPDDYAILQERSKFFVFSYGSALYLWGLSDITPHYIDITIPQGTNVSRIKKQFPDTRFHFIKKELYDFGITTIITPMGNQVKVYDKERCICDLIRSRKNVDMQLYTQVIKDYFNDNPNLRMLLKYGKLFNIEDKIRTYAEVLI